MMQFEQYRALGENVLLGFSETSTPQSKTESATLQLNVKMLHVH